jgi:hypothetical protein
MLPERHRSHALQREELGDHAAAEHLLLLARDHQQGDHVAAIRERQAHAGLPALERRDRAELGPSTSSGS